ncbi:MAG: phosphotransferase, partial [bacterium]|nr:phosphotransferase [bacterium]
STLEQRNALTTLVERELGAKLLRLESIAPGLGNRRFFRLHIAAEEDTALPARVIARIEAEEDPAKRAPGVAPEPPLEPLRRFLEAAQIPVPKRVGADLELGVELLEDVGELSLEHLARGTEPAERRALYSEACSLIPRLQRLEAPEQPPAAFLRSLDRTLFESKAARVIDWALPWWLGREPSPAEREVVRAVFARVADACENSPLRLSHRDMKAANIHLREGAPAGARLVLIDLQGAFMAPPEYDLVCLLRDSHVPLPADEVTAHLAATRPQLPDAPDPETFSERFTLLTLSRVAKDAAHYIHAFTAHGDPRYLPLLPTARLSLREASLRAAGWDPVLERYADLVHKLREPATDPGDHSA